MASGFEHGMLPNRIASIDVATDAHRLLASVIIHEEWHVKHGRDEVEAYNAQLITMQLLGARPGNPAYTMVWRSARAALARRKAADRMAKLVAKEAGANGTAP